MKGSWAKAETCGGDQDSHSPRLGQVPMVMMMVMMVGRMVMVMIMVGMVMIVRMMTMMIGGMMMANRNQVIVNVKISSYNILRRAIKSDFWKKNWDFVPTRYSKYSMIVKFG